jgi:peptide/nickel transport system permease protein
MLFMMSIFYFLLIHAIPGGPDAVLFNPKLSAAARIALRHAYGLDQPLWTQYWNWLTQVLRGNFGTSFADGQSVLSDFGARFPATLELFAAGFAFALVLAIPIGIYSAVRQYSITDYIISVLTYFGISMPVFLLGLLLQDIFGVKLGLLPVFGISSPFTTGFTPLENFEDRVVHLILPMTAFGLLFVAVWSRFLRSSMLDAIKQDYVRTARAKGMSTRVTLTRHAMRNALIPFITQLAIDFGGITAGAIITENVFAWPGVGTLLFNSIGQRDYPVLLAMLIIITATVIVFNLLADSLYGIVDPRIRYS